MVMCFPLCTLAPDILRFGHDSLVGFGIFYDAFKAYMLNRRRALKVLMAVQRPILKSNNDVLYRYILIVSKHRSANSVSPALINLYIELLSTVGNVEIN